MYQTVLTKSTFSWLVAVAAVAVPEGEAGPAEVAQEEALQNKQTFPSHRDQVFQWLLELGDLAEVEQLIRVFPQPGRVRALIQR
jgi:hypothetical protein